MSHPENLLQKKVRFIAVFKMIVVRVQYDVAPACEKAGVKRSLAWPACSKDFFLDLSNISAPNTQLQRGLNWTSRLTRFYRSCGVKAACEPKNSNLQRMNHRHFALELSPFYHLLFHSLLLWSEFLQLYDWLLNGVLPLFRIKGLDLIDSA